MIVLKILLWVILAIIGIILLFLIIPVSAETAYIDKKFTYKIKYGFVNIYGSDKKGIAVKFIDKHINKNDDDFDEDTDIDEISNIEDNIEELLMPEPDEIYNNDEIDDITENDADETVSDDEISDNTAKDSERENEKSTFDEDDEKKGKLEKIFDRLDENEDKIEMVLDMLRSADRPLIHICKGFRFSNIYIDFMITGEDAYKCALKYGEISGAVYNIIGWISTVCTAKFKTVDIFPDYKSDKSRWDISVKLGFRLITLIVAGIYFLITYMFRFFIPQKLQEKKLKKSRKSKKSKK